MNYCPYCGKKNDNHYTFENSFEPGNEIKLPSSNDFERLVKIPASQAVIYGVSTGLIFGLLAVKTFGIIAVPIAILICWTIAWTLISNLFNRLVLNSLFAVELPEPEQEIITIYDIKQEDNTSIKRGEIRATQNQIREWCKSVATDLQLGGRDKVNITHSRFTKDLKLFSQPAYKNYLADLEELSIIRRKNTRVKNSPYMLTNVGLNFVERNR